MATTRKLVRITLAAAVPLVVAPVIGEWFVKYAEQKGVYENPSGRLGAAMNWLMDLIATWLAPVAAWPGFHYFAVAVVCFAAGVWLDTFLRRRGGDWRQVEAYVASPSLTVGVEPDLPRPDNRNSVEAPRENVPFDIKLEGTYNNDVTIFSAVVRTRETTEVGVIIGRSAECVHYLSGVRWRWAQPRRLVEEGKLFVGEEARVELVRRVKESDEDHIILLGETIPLTEPVTLFLVCVDAVFGNKKARLKQAFNVRNIRGERLTEKISLGDIAYAKNADPP